MNKKFLCYYRIMVTICIFSMMAFEALAYENRCKICKNESLYKGNQNLDEVYEYRE